MTFLVGLVWLRGRIAFEQPAFVQQVWLAPRAAAWPKGHLAKWQGWSQAALRRGRYGTAPTCAAGITRA
ncbi:hypothetical protein SM19410_01580 [Xanthomonas hortorum pv. gardneri]|nr:hypothetical protein BJD10_12185 [Xanthomonas hortorum pv. gardneri]ASW45670.1 hypothetical protein XJ27_06555 [Xanthomonas hortorum]QNM60706.1 hypothetical protein XHV734_1911 [Xanthomonas hortorum pv. vitians]APP84475.1 hypothetical protein BI317_10115 [Xanthomonas hortorum pv. gardneri]KLA95116.1 hypothetical protein SM18210_21440 [Xanthomonas hortorum pv. gardneri]